MSTSSWTVDVLIAAMGFVTGLPLIGFGLARLAGRGTAAKAALAGVTLVAAIVGAGVVILLGGDFLLGVSVIGAGLAIVSAFLTGLRGPLLLRMRRVWSKWTAVPGRSEKQSSGEP